MSKHDGRSRVRPEYVSPHPGNSHQTWQARLELIEVGKQVFPRFLRKLATDVFPLYSRLATNGTLAREGYDFSQALWQDDLRGLLENVVAEELRRPLLKWAEEFNAQAEWLVLGALRSLDGWHRDPEWRQSLHWDTLHGRSEEAIASKPFEFYDTGWEVCLFSWPAYRAVLWRRFEERLLAYEREARRLAESHGLVRATKKHSRHNLEWFVLYQFAGKSSGAICQHYADIGTVLEESTVLKGIKAAARRIGWGDLREPRQRPNRKPA
jgi:hypothetical protein